MVDSEGELLAVQIRPVDIISTPMTRFSHVTMILTLILSIMLYVIYIYIYYICYKNCSLYANANANAKYNYIYISSHVACMNR